jgi:choice-of-anchor C domain-containing protein
LTTDEKTVDEGLEFGLAGYGGVNLIVELAMAKAMKSAVAVAVLALGVSLGAVGASANLVTNGSFELGNNLPGAGFNTKGNGSTDIAGWTVGGNSVDWISTYWPATDGNLSLDLNGNGKGSISQAINVVAGQKYTLTFDFARNTDGGGLNETVKISLPGTAPTPVTFTAFGSAQANQWVTVGYEFVAAITGSALLTFAGVGANDPFGIALDNVNVSAVPLPGALLLLLSGLAGVGALGRSRRRTVASV